MQKIAAIHYSYFPHDTRPRREAEGLVEAGMSVDIICARESGQPATEKIGSIEVHRISVLKDRGGKLNYIMQYFSFILLAFLKLSALHIRKRYDIIHVHNMPDFLVFASLLPKLCGSRIVLDLHDPMPELYMTKYHLGRDSLIISVLKVLERWSIRYADMVITPNIAFRNLFISRGCPEEKIHIVMNSPMEKVFHKGGAQNAGQSTERKKDQFVIMFHGGVYERQGLDTALEAIASLRDEIPNLIFKVFGDGDYVTQFLKLVNDYDLKEVVKFHGYTLLDKIPQEIRSMDLGIIPNNKSPFTDLNFPVRIFEYLCLGKPVIVPKTQGILDYFDENSMFFFEPGNAESLSRAILEIYRRPSRLKEVTDRGSLICARYRWELQRQYFVGLINELIKPDPQPQVGNNE